MPRQIRHTTKPLSKRQSWWLHWLHNATTEERDTVEGIMFVLRKDLPLPPGWWQEGEGRERMTMNQRTAVETRAFLKEALAWRAQQAARAEVRS